MSPVTPRYERMVAAISEKLALVPCEPHFFTGFPYIISGVYSLEWSVDGVAGSQPVVSCYHKHIFIS